MMATSFSNLEYSIFAMDAYNQGYDAGMPSTTGVPDGAVKLLETQIGSAGEAAGFYAVAYEYNGEIIISYRGTDDPFADAQNGWQTGAGGVSEQAKLALEFYNIIAEKPEAATNNIVLTGHSMGGGFAGYVAALHGLDRPANIGTPFKTRGLV